MSRHHVGHPAAQTAGARAASSGHGGDHRAGPEDANRVPGGSGPLQERDHPAGTTDRAAHRPAASGVLV